MKQEYIQRLFDFFMKTKDLRTRGKIFTDITQQEFIILHTILRYVKGTGKMSVAELNKCFCVSGPAISQMLRALEKKNWIHRSWSETDRRVVYIAVTEEGNAQIKECVNKMIDVMSDIFEELSEADAEKFFEILEKINCILGKYQD